MRTETEESILRPCRGEKRRLRKSNLHSPRQKVRLDVLVTAGKRLTGKEGTVSMVDGHERTPSSSSSSSAILRLPGENRFAFPPDRDGSASFNRLSRKLFDDSSFHPWTQTCSWYRKSIGEFLTLSSTTRYFSFSFFSRVERKNFVLSRGANPTRSSACDEIWRNVIA